MGAATIRAAIIGGTGYTGSELLRLLHGHPQVEVVAISSRSEAGRPVEDIFPAFAGITDLCFSDPAEVVGLQPDLVFFATPHGVAQASARHFLDAGIRVVDLSADFRIRDLATWEQWYGQKHAAPELIEGAVYGLPELHREKITDARLVACPGCYPTAVQLGWAPLLEQDLIEPASLLASCGSGVSGAGRNAKVPYLLCEAGENFQAYATGGHRHEPEIVQGCRDLQPASAEPAEVLFLPHLVPMLRGIHATLIADLKSPGADLDLQQLFVQRYAQEPFVTVLPPGSQPNTKQVRGTNNCCIAVHRRGNRVVVLASEDNLTRGASGQAVQCMNILFGLPECTGLEMVALLP